MSLSDYYNRYGSLIPQASERLLVDEFLFPLLGANVLSVIPQRPFIDSTGRCRRIDFSYVGLNGQIAIEIDGETYHAEGVIPNETFDDNLFRQNEILGAGYRLARFSYSQLQSPTWRPLVKEKLTELFRLYAPELLPARALTPSQLQNEALDAIAFYRDTRGWDKGVVVLPTGTGKTILSALDAKRHGGKVLFLVHRLDILKQSIDAYKIVWPDVTVGLLTGEAKERERDCDVLFASKDSLRQPDVLTSFGRSWFDYVVVDEVHHGQSPTYREILSYLEPAFMLGMTATPDRTDRRDIFELFDYNKMYEVSLNEVVERGYLVPYTYYGLTDNIDYSRVRYDNHRYRVDDLERLLIIPERNAQIVKEYLEKGHGDKAIGFCVSITHAERMADVFNSEGIAAAAVHSASPERAQILADFRDNKLQVVFTVDLFNEGIDIPNVRVLLFLRPTESKTVFIQQLGRGLRQHPGKDRLTVLDFIGNYQRANQIRQYLASGSQVVEITDGERKSRKVEYVYAPGCEVHFDPSVEEILDRQDAASLGVNEDDLKNAYFDLAERIERKPSRADLDAGGQYKSNLYTDVFGSWVAFLRAVGEYTEASYHYPQGVHLGHILSILWVFGQDNRAGTHFDDDYIRLRGNLGDGRLASYRRQVKYKLLAAMELGILTDDRNFASETDYSLGLTPLGQELYTALQPVLARLDLQFPVDTSGIPSTQMRADEQVYNTAIRDEIARNPAARKIVYQVLLGMTAVQQMLMFLYHVARKQAVPRAEIYEQFFQAPFVRRFCDQEGIEEATIEASRRRCPFLLNILDACGVLEAQRTQVELRKLALASWLVAPHAGESRDASLARLAAVSEAWPSNNAMLEDEDLSILRELFGATFLTPDYHLGQLELVEEVSM